MVLRDVRNARALSQWQLVKAAASHGWTLSRAALSHFETGTRLPTLTQMHVLIDTLNCTPREVRLFLDSAAVDDVRYTAFSLSNRGLSDIDYLLRWEEFYATVTSPLIPEVVPQN